MASIMSSLLAPIVICVLISVSILKAESFTPPRASRAFLLSAPTRSCDWIKASMSGNSDDDYDDYSNTSSSPRNRKQRVRPRRPTTPSSSSLDESTQDLQIKAAQRRHQEALKDPTLLTNLVFGDSPDIHPAHKRALNERMGLQQMTEIQARTWDPLLAGTSLVGRARTGTGKTVAFLLPAVERLRRADPVDFMPGRNLGVLIVAPTRELAIQIAEQATALLSFRNGAAAAAVGGGSSGASTSTASPWKVLCMYGGTKMQRDLRELNRGMPVVLVATPGRLKDHIEETRLRGKPFSDKVAETQILVLDEADRLLEGFAKEMKIVLGALPRSHKRQSMMFSASMPSSLIPVIHQIMPSDYLTVDCIKEVDNNRQTNTRVEQSYIVLQDMNQYVSSLVNIVRNAMQEDPDAHKLVVFFPTAKLVKFFVHLFTEGLGIPVIQIHSRMSQGSRNSASSMFRGTTKSILFTSDVSARGVDYPDVSLVIQYGAPTSNAVYFHRLGRTGRAGNAGAGLIVLLPFETSFLLQRSVKGIQEATEYVVDGMAETEEMLQPIQNHVASSHSIWTPLAEGAWQSFVAHYVEYAKRDVRLKDLDVIFRALALGFGFEENPSLPEELEKRIGRK